MDRTTVYLNSTLFLLVVIAMLVTGCSGDPGSLDGADAPGKAAFTESVIQSSNDQAALDIGMKRADTEGFLAAWERALSVEHATVGSIEVTIENVIDTDVRRYGVRRARLGNRELDQTATSALITASVDGSTTNTACEESSSGQFICSASEAGLPRRERLNRLADAVGGEDSDYESFAVADTIDGATCWLVERRPGSEPTGWGDMTTFCFDDSVGSVTLQETIVEHRNERFVAASVSGDPTEDDVDPLPGLRP